MTDWKQVRDEGAGEYECATQHPERKWDENGYKYRDFQAGYDYAIENDPRVKAMREALEFSRARLLKVYGCYPLPYGTMRAERQELEKIDEALTEVSHVKFN